MASKAADFPTYSLVTEAWSGSTGTVKVAGAECPICQQGGWLPDTQVRLGSVHVSGRGSKKDAVGFLEIDGKKVPVGPYSAKGSFFRKKLGWIRAKGPDGKSFYVQATKARGSAIAAVFCGAAAAGLIAFWLSSGIAPQDIPVILADQAGITHNNEGAHADISYAAFSSTPDQTWKAGQLDQDTVLLLPAEVTTKDADGNESVSDNPVIASPHIYVDLNGDGEFSDDECVYNPVQKDSDGNITDYGKFLEPGNQISGITLTKEVPAGSYSAETVWTPLMKDDQSPANQMTFNWNLTVE